MGGAAASARHAGASDCLALSVAVAADLLDHKGSLADGLEALTTTAPAGCCRGARLRLCALACTTDIGPSEVDRLGRPVDCLHEFDLHVELNILTFGLHLLATSTRSTLPAKHLLELLKDVSKALPLSLLPKLVLEAFKATKSLTERTSLSTKRTLASKGILLLLVCIHASLVIDAPLALI